MISRDHCSKTLMNYWAKLGHLPGKRQSSGADTLIVSVHSETSLLFSNKL